MRSHATPVQKDSARRPTVPVLAVLLAGLSLSACAPATSTGATGTATSGAVSTGPSATPTSPTYAAIVAQLTPTAQYKTFLNLLAQTDLATTLPPGAVTVFAPTDAAFFKLTGEQFSAIVGDPARRRQVLLNHIVSGTLTVEQVRNGTQFTTLQGGAVAVAATSGGVRLGTANVELTPIVTTDLTIFSIDTVLLPS